MFITYEKPAVKCSKCESKDAKAKKSSKGAKASKKASEMEKLFIEFGKKKGEPGYKNELKHISGTTYEFRCDGYAFQVTFQLTEFVSSNIP